MGVGAEKRQCLSPASFSAHRKPAQIRPKPARNPSLGQGCYPPPEGDHAAAHKGKQGGDSRVGACGMIQQAGGSGCARLQRTQLPPASRPRRAAGAFSLVTAWSFCAASGLPQTWKHSCSNGWTQRSLKFARNRLEVLIWCWDATTP